tara:strand:+ start:5523 stop:6593 length:1071 start_codon:yes stop_codon:yes gene_type:complete
MTEQLLLAMLDTVGCSVSSNISKFLDSGSSPGIGIEVKNAENLDEGLLMLDSGEADILAVPASVIHGRRMEMLQAGLEIVGARTPQRPYSLLVSDNKLQYQPKSAIILCGHKLVRRQLRRARRGIRVLDPVAFSSITGMDPPPGDPISTARWMEGLRESGEIDGFVAQREIYDAAGLVSRRHSLLPDPPSAGEPHFLPIPYSDLVVLIARRMFPVSISEQISEKEGETCWWVHDNLIGSLDKEMLDKTGILVRHRQVRSLIKQAEDNRDLVLEQVCQDPDGKVIEDEVHVEMRIEYVSKDGKKTVGLHRVIRHSDFERATIASLRDWETLLKETSRDVPKDFHTDPDAPSFISLDD